MTSLYRSVLGPAWAQLPQPIRDMHSPGQDLIVRGRASVERGTGLAARVAALLFGFPAATDDVPVQVGFQVENGVEHWRRDFGGARFTSHQYRGTGRHDGLVMERFGPFSFALELRFDGTCLHLVVRGWHFLGLPLPAFFAPGGNTYEHVQDGRFCFHVEIAHRWLGLIVRYQGWLAPV